MYQGTRSKVNPILFLTSSPWSTSIQLDALLTGATSLTCVLLLHGAFGYQREEKSNYDYV